MTESTHLPCVEFAFPGPLRDALVASILAGTKTATTGLLEQYEVEGEPLPLPGGRQRVIDSRGRVVAVIETIEVRVVRLADVPARHVVDEGENHASMEAWRVAHERFWCSPPFLRILGRSDLTVDDDTQVVVERFELVSVSI